MGVLTGWTVFGALMAIHLALRTTPPDVAGRLVHVVPFYWLWAALTPVMLHAARRFDVRRETWPIALSAHAATAVGLAITQSALYAAALGILPRGEWPDAFIDRFMRTITVHGAGNLFTYIVVVGGLVAFRRYRRSRIREVQRRRVPPSADEDPERLAIKIDGRITFVRPSDIDWVEAAGDYVKVHVGTQRHLHRSTLVSILERLDERRFARIHRSTVVNLDRVAALEPYFRGDYIVILENGTRLKLSRSYRDPVAVRLGTSL